MLSMKRSLLRSSIITLIMCLIVSGNLFAQDLEDDLTEKKLMDDF